MRGNIQGLLAQAQKMQKNVERLQAELGNIEVLWASRHLQNPLRIF